MNDKSIEKVRAIAESCKDKDALLVMRTNCRDKNNMEAVDLVENVLDSRFPNWETSDGTRTRNGGNVPTNARFQSHAQKFPSQIDAYIWLVNHFLTSSPNMLKLDGKDDGGLVRLLLGKRKENAMHFAPEARSLAKKTAVATENDSRPVQLDCGWWANTVLSGTQKLRLLERIAERSGIGKDEWSWEPERKSANLQKEITQRANGQALLDEFARQK